MLFWIIKFSWVECCIFSELFCISKKDRWVVCSLKICVNRGIDGWFEWFNCFYENVCMESLIFEVILKKFKWLIRNNRIYIKSIYIKIFCKKWYKIWNLLNLLVIFFEFKIKMNKLE